jgi:hypothetical protein
MAAGVGYLILDFARAVISQERREANQEGYRDDCISDLGEWSSSNPLRCGLATTPGCRSGGFRAGVSQQVFLIELPTTSYGQAVNTTVSNIVLQIEKVTADALDVISEGR